MTQTITNVYDDPATARQVVAALEDAGFTSDEVSIVRQNEEGWSNTDTDDDSSGAATGATVGLAAGTGAGLLVSLGLVAIPGLGPLVAAGVLATTLAGAAAGAVGGGIIGALTDFGVSEDDAQVYAENIRRGGTLVSVRTDESRASIAEEIMHRMGPVDIAERGNAYRGEGWTSYDPASPAYSRDEIETERNRYRTM